MQDLLTYKKVAQRLAEKSGIPIPKTARTGWIRT